MNVTIEDSWKTTLSEEFKKDYFKQLSAEVKGSYLLNEPPIYPPASLVFNAFNLTPLDEVKVVILGQDPYHGIGQECNAYRCSPGRHPAGRCQR